MRKRDLVLVPVAEANRGYEQHHGLGGAWREVAWQRTRAITMVRGGRSRTNVVVVLRAVVGRGESPGVRTSIKAGL